MKRGGVWVATILFLTAGVVWGQVKRCIFDEIHKGLTESPSFVDKNRAWARLAQQAAKTQAEDVPVITVPIVVHVIHTGGQDNVSENQILSQVEVLNEDYRAKAGTAGERGFDTKIEFCLAKLDPDGNPTTGITRTQSPLAEHVQADEAALKALIRWDPERYLNIWVVKSIGGEGENRILGYARYPEDPAGLDGVVISYRNFGRTGILTPPYNRGRTLTHEIGHSLGLFHPFQGGCLGSLPSTCLEFGDNICDTPQSLFEAFGCNVGDSANTCAEYPFDGPDANDNYMNYGNDACMHRFTPGQAVRMRNVFEIYPNRKKLVSPENLVSTGCATGKKANKAAPNAVVRLFPRPCNGTFTLEAEGDWKMRIFDVTGRFFGEYSGTGTQQVAFDATTGVYSALVQNNRQIFKQKIVVVR